MFGRWLRCQVTKRDQSKRRLEVRDRTETGCEGEKVGTGFLSARLGVTTCLPIVALNERVPNIGSNKLHGAPGQKCQQSRTVLAGAPAFPHVQRKH